MRWYEKLYVGEKAKKHRYETIQAVRNGRPMGFYVLTPAAGERNLLDIYPALTLKLSSVLPSFVPVTILRP